MVELGEVGKKEVLWAVDLDPSLLSNVVPAGLSRLLIRGRHSDLVAQRERGLTYAVKRLRGPVALALFPLKTPSNPSEETTGTHSSESRNTSYLRQVPKPTDYLPTCLGTYLPRLSPQRQASLQHPPPPGPLSA